MPFIAVQSILVIFGLFFLYTGIASFLQPEKFANSLSLNPIGKSGRIEIQAQYGGFFFFAGLSQFAPFTGWLPYSAALTVAAVIFGGLIMGRVLSLFTQRSPAPITRMIKSLYVIDGLGFAATIFALYSL